jgi:hypothetical protein
MPFEMDQRPYFQILHNLIRHDEFNYDPDKTSSTVNWLRERAQTLRRINSEAEHKIFTIIYAFWDKNKEAPSRSSLNELIREQSKIQDLLNVMTEYDSYASSLDQVADFDLHVIFEQRKTDWEKRRLCRILEIATSIVIGEQELGKGKDAVIYKGPKDALKFLGNKIQQGLLLDDVGVTGGLLADTMEDMEQDYVQEEVEAKNNNLFIPTGIGPIDGHMGGLRRKELNGILGYVGQKKSTVLRTIGYNAAYWGFRVLHIPLESDCKEEQRFYGVQHAAIKSDTGITKKRLDRAVLSEEDKKLFFGEVIPDFRESVGQNLIVYTPGDSRSWADAKMIIERENDKQPLDLVLIDYITMLKTPGARDDIADKMEIVQDAKRLALNSNNGKGMCILTPIQGNRKGFEEAADNNGQWETTGVSKYSELDKSLDNLFYVYFDDEMNGQNRMKIGSCKTRRDADIPATFVSVNPASGMIEKTTEADIHIAAPVKESNSVSPEIDEMEKYL